MDAQASVRYTLEHLKAACIFISVSAYYLTVPLISRNRPTIYLDDFHVSSLNKTSSNTLTNATTIYFDLDDFHVSSLNKTSSNTLTNATTIYFDLKIQNENSWVGVYYNNPLNLTISYIPPTIATTRTETRTRTRTTNNVIIAKKAIQGFYQGNGKVKHVKAFVVVQDLFSESEQGRRMLGETYVSGMGPVKVVGFKVDLDAKIKFKSFEVKKLDVVVGGDVEVNGDTGSFILKNSVQLKYASGSNKWGVQQWFLFFLLFISFAVVASIIWFTLASLRSMLFLGPFF